MKNYLALVQDIFDNGSLVETRPKVRAWTVFGRQLRWDLANGFPLVTTKKVHFKGIVGELLWFLSGSTNNNDLEARGVTIWKEWAKEDGDLGPIYGKQWRNFGGVDQIVNAENLLRNNPTTRQNLVVAWNPIDLPEMRLPPCHYSFQLRILDNRLNLHVTLRSLDVFLGMPYNIASYALLCHLFAMSSGLQLGDLVLSSGDTHVYENHVDQMTLQLRRVPHTLPILRVKPKPSVLDYTEEDIELLDYNSHPAIKGEVAV